MPEASGVSDGSNMQRSEHVVPLIERDRLQSIVQRLIEIGTSVHQLAVLLAGLSTTPANNPPANKLPSNDRADTSPAVSTIVDLIVSAAMEAQSVAEVHPHSGDRVDPVHTEVTSEDSKPATGRAAKNVNEKTADDEDVSGIDSLAVQQQASVQDDNDIGVHARASDPPVCEPLEEEAGPPRAKAALNSLGTVNAADSVMSSEHGKTKGEKSSEEGIDVKVTITNSEASSQQDSTAEKDLKAGERQNIDYVIVENDLTASASKESHPVEESCQPIAVKLPQPDCQWQPLPVRKFVPLKSVEADNIPDKESTQTFTLDLIKRTLGGDEWSSGFYWVRGQLAFGIGGYYVVSQTTDPCAPSEPGKHGAKLVPFYNQSQDHGSPEQEIFQDAPLFVAVPGDKDADDEFAYFGHYSQSRLTDLLSYDHQAQHVPRAVKEYWASQLASSDRPRWMTEAIKDHFFMQPAYGGDLSNIKSKGGRIDIPEDLREYVLTLRDWDDDCKERLKHMTAQDFLNAFEAAEHDDPPGLRLQIEYLECVRFDRNLYDALVEIKHHDIAPSVRDGHRFSNAPPGWNIVGLSVDNFPPMPGAFHPTTEGSGSDGPPQPIPRRGYVPPHRRAKPNGTVTSTEDMSKDESA